MTKKPISDALRIPRVLRALGRPTEKAPATLLPAVLERVGLSDRYWRLASPLGTVYVAHSKAGISMVSRAASPAAFERRFRNRFGRPVAAETHVAPARIKALVRNLKGEGRRELAFDLRGLSEFERAVLLKAREIPRGETRTYGWVAAQIGRPAAVRAVGTALRKNPVPVFIPCHRVVRSDGQLGQYALGGTEVKRAILEAEGVATERLLRRASA